MLSQTVGCWAPISLTTFACHHVSNSWLFDEFLPAVGEDNVLLVYYELLKEDTPRELRRIRDFLKLDASDDVLQCAADESTTDKLHELSDETLLIPPQVRAHSCC